MTHDQVEAMTLADKLVVMNKGVAEQIDTPIKIYERPATTFVASFIGSPAMNLLRGSSAGPKGIALAGGQAVKPRDFQVPETGRGRVSSACARSISPWSNGGNSDLELKVIAVESLGADTMAHGVLAGSSGPAEKIIVRLPGAASNHGRRRAAARDQPRHGACLRRADGEAYLKPATNRRRG